MLVFSVLSPMGCGRAEMEQALIKYREKWKKYKEYYEKSDKARELRDAEEELLRLNTHSEEGERERRERERERGRERESEGKREITRRFPITVTCCLLQRKRWRRSFKCYNVATRSSLELVGS